MTLTQILYTLAVARYLNFSRAAESLFVSQPALSLQIKNLETELGYDLFIRTPHGISLTDLGAQFCQDAQPLEEQWVLFQNKILDGSQDRCRQLRIGMGARVYSNRLFEDVVQFFDAHPRIEVTFVTEAGQDYLTAMREGKLDVALDRLPPARVIPNQTGFVSYHLIQERQCILLAKGDPRSALSEMTFQDLQGCTVITGLENSMEDRTLKQECQDYGITLKRIYRSDGIETNMNLLRKGMGVVIGPESFANYYGVAAVPLVPEVSVYLDFICLKRNANRPEIAAIRKHLMQSCKASKKISNLPSIT